MTYSKHSRKQHGFSLVELMVAVALSLILMAGVMSIFFSSKVTYFANEQTARLQESGRIALDLMVHDIRSAGYPGCAKQTLNSRLNNDTALLWNYAVPLAGFEATGGGVYSPALGAVLNPAPVDDSDVIVVRMLLRDGQAMTMQTDLASTTDNPQVLDPGSAPVGPNQILMITDCNASSIFQATGWTPGAPNGRILHADCPLPCANGPGNSTVDLGYLYQAGARILPLQTVVYWVGLDPLNGNEPSLYRQMGNSPPEVLIAGVQALQIAYGLDTNADRTANTYVAANAVGANWDNVVSVSLALLVRSEATGTDIDRGSYPLLDPVNSPALGGKLLQNYNDRRQRMMFSTTVVVRNRAL